MNYNHYHLLLFSILFYVSSNSMAQDSLSSRNSVYAELGGNSVVFSINYERVIINNLVAKAGLGFCVLPISKSSKSNDKDWSFFPLYNIMAQYFLRVSQQSSFGLNLGLGFTGSLHEGNAILLATKIGIRYSPYDGGFQLDLSYTPLWDSENKIISWFGIGIGQSF